MRDRTAARRLWAAFRPHRPGLALAVLLMSVHAAVPGALVVLVQRVLDDVLIRQDAVQLALVPVALVALYALNGALTVGRGLLTRSIAWDVVTTLRGQLFAHLLRQDVAWHQRQSTGELTARLTNDVNNLQYGVSGVVTAFQKPLTLIVLLGAAFKMNPRLAGVAVAVLPLVAWPISRFGQRLRATSRDSLDQLAALTGTLTETLAGVRVVQTAQGEATRQARFDEANQAQRQAQLRAFAAQLIPGPVVELIAAVGVGVVIWVGGRQVFAGEVAPGALIAFLVALGLLNEPLKGITQIQALIQRSLASAEQIFALLDRPSAIEDRGTLDLPPGPVSLRFEEVGFRYGGRGEDSADRAVLSGLSFEAAPGQMVALVGASGAGKSTVAHLLPRLWDPSTGRILLGGHDLRDYRLASLRRGVALVSQDTFLFNDTVRENIRFGTAASDAEVEQAAQVANAADFIAALPQGYDTRIDELGLRLSGGQRQRICIARAVLRAAPLLVLDEATSALDAESEVLVQEALERLMRDRTVLAIAHRLSTIREADLILVLDEGRVVERGDHATLMAAGGAYARLVRRQEGEPARQPTGQPSEAATG